MKIEGRQRRTLVIGGIGAALIVVVGHGILPLVRAWSQMGDRLEPKLEYVAKLRARVHGHDSLLARRNALVRQLGSLCGPEPAAEDKPSDKPEAEGSEPAAADKPSDKPEAEGAEPKEAGEAAPPENPETQAAAEKKADDAAPVPGPDATTVTVTAEGEKVTVVQGNAESGADKAAAEKTAAGPAEAPATEEAPGAEEGKAPDEKTPTPAPPSSSGVYLATYLERIAEQSGVKINRVSPRKNPAGQKARNHIVPVMLQLSVEGDIQGLIKALYAIEKGDRLMRIEQIQLRRNIEKGSAIEATLDVMGYEAVARRP